MTALAFDDVLIVPKYSDVLPHQVDTSVQLTPHIKLNIPLISSAMDTVTMAPMAIAMAKLGGMGIIHKNLSIKDQVSEVEKVKRFGGGIVKNPFSVRSDQTLYFVKEMIRDTGYSSFPVIEDEYISVVENGYNYVDHKQILVGLITARDIKFSRDDNVTVESVMTPFNNLIVADVKSSKEVMIELMYNHKIERLPLVSYAESRCYFEGLVTLKDFTLLDSYPNAAFDNHGRLIVGAAIGVTENDRKRAKKLVDAGVNALVIDTAHGHSSMVLETVRWARQTFPWTSIIAGNVVTEKGAFDLMQYGAHCIKVGVGPGSICTTRVVSGVGVPQFTAIQNCKKMSQATIIADGGIRYSGDIFKALVAGADAVMIGSLFAGANEAPGDVELYQGRSYKHYRGMGSIGAMTGQYGSSDRYKQSNISSEKLVPEGIEGRVPCSGPLSNIIHQLVGGLRAGMGYIGAKTISEIAEKAEYIEISHAGVLESHPHDVSITKESVNYKQTL